MPNSKNGIKEYETYEDKNIITWKQKLMFRYFEIFLMKYLKAKNFCPGIIVVAKKGNILKAFIDMVQKFF